MAREARMMARVLMLWCRAMQLFKYRQGLEPEALAERLGLAVLVVLAAEGEELGAQQDADGVLGSVGQHGIPEVRRYVHGVPEEHGEGGG